MQISKKQHGCELYEPKDMYRCHPYHFMEICNPPVNEPIGSYQIHHLKYFNTFFALNHKHDAQIMMFEGYDSMSKHNKQNQ